VKQQWIDQLVEQWPSYFQFPDQPQGSVSTSSAVESASPDRVAAQEAGRRIVPIEQRQAEVPAQKVAAYCVKQAPEGVARTGAMVPVDANCNCPEGYSRVGECLKAQPAESSKWWLWLLAGAGVYYWYNRR
jgi:hypothetical protein